ncbi:integumentary mucin A.1-like [Coturnix japonica]|uniref:integumentary mucin A.1-like n=1 Tax=Coturnix japonica TaxID=93934 RepID=UPI0013A5E075|nr:integumentary mucin A.1-like [Coturnix japonica]
MATRRGGLSLFLLLGLAGSKLALGSIDADSTVPKSTKPPVSLLSTAAPTPPSSPDTEAPTPVKPSTAPGTSNAPATSAHTAAPPEPSTVVVDTATSITNTVVLRSTPSPSPPPGNTTGTSTGVSTVITGTPADTSMAPQSSSATPGTKPSSPATTSSQSLDGTISTSSELPPTCPSTPNDAIASQLFLSLRLTTPLDMGNTTVQELLLAKLRRDLQAAFPHAGLLLYWRGGKLI